MTNNDKSIAQEHKYKTRGAIINLIIGEILLIPLYYLFGSDYRFIFWILATSFTIFTVFCIIAVIYYNKTHKDNTRE